MKYLFITLFILALSVSAISPVSAGSCSLRTSRDGKIVTIVSGPCWYRDFPANCQVPKRISVGQRILCTGGGK